MSKKSSRWPMWKIITALLGCTLASAAFYVAGFLVEKQNLRPADPEDAGPAALLGMSTLLLMFGTVGVLLAILCAIWIGFRIYESRIPPWERNVRKGRRR